jgi:hypothetical protein
MWDIYIIRKKGILLGTIEATDEALAIAKASSLYGQDTKQLFAVRSGI